MTRKKMRPEAPGSAFRTSENVLANNSESTLSPFTLQAAFIAARFGALDPSLIAAIAALAFSTTSGAR